MKRDAAKQNLLSELLNQEDYKELGHSILLRNDTSGTSFLDYKSITIRELKEDSLCLELPKNVCQNGHSLTLIFFSSPLKTLIGKFPSVDSTSGIPIIGKVIEHLINEEKVNIEIKFTQYKPTLWNSLLETYEAQQRKISSLISKVKK
ncbi:hypothetical protein A9Q84_03705 [Halobacteriovorax marinus]|uniref:Uncharacterized protein n=1 Tax=Halobacteriovorax marinus TaxID=97084 RepID=A0A1Y5FAK7_9BACT|nr:hypothetical protein A9Q84_03705 [Halobacteriovorax marinus]